MNLPLLSSIQYGLLIVAMLTLGPVQISMCEIYKAIPQLMQAYTFELGSEEEMRTTSYWLHKPVAIEVKVRRR